MCFLASQNLKGEKGSKKHILFLENEKPQPDCLEDESFVQLFPGYKSRVPSGVTGLCLWGPELCPVEDKEWAPGGWH